ncbi:EscV/YscV/HrcV family type III secretion system export apparatus protein [Vibrio zhanjiangensis]|uniref:EscV/YscV/HrcV family type III secretion system export apparatus protein n=1 Tax=Vibrio zhanjiangensis TaxID=1046128 RepID=A0ABQ6F3I3_9VIBR|nr:type III secretion system export apparatus subunit SctV [Vibrio zhanjiangensis]GLT19802.1 EscV/YscV/HrcV family type III secretion system export apparatus protein [Vibrio zhanjiangensis]
MKNILAKLSGRNDLFLAMLLIAVVFMMILPMPTGLVDVLIATNLTIAVILLMMAIYIHTPLEFTVFPSLLLLTTLFRLSLSITTTRLILLQADAGQIVYTFGEFVVGGNLVVGAVIFLIITIVQFLVITKGAERVAEVSARFSLDAMPGKQMSIDGDMRAGTIDMEEAQERRSKIEKESQLYGAMDGAMKFVKGDAIAGLIIIVVNLLGGIAIGMSQHGLSAGDALSIYALLTIGDGLISQIPALFIAITSGMIVTRVSSEKSADLGKDISTQIKQQPNALLIGGVILLLFALLPGFPTFTFLGLSTLLFFAAYWLNRAAKKTPSNSDRVDTVTEGDGPGTDKQEGFSLTQPLSFSIRELPEKGMTIERLVPALTDLRQKLTTELGVPFPTIHLYSQPAKDNSESLNAHYQLFVHEVPVLSGYIAKNDKLVTSDEQQLKMLDMSYEKSTFLNKSLFWIKDQTVETIGTMGLDSVDELDALVSDLHSLLSKHAQEFIGVQETKLLLEHIESEYEELVKEVQRQLPVFKLTEILQRLVSEQVPIRNLRTILEAVVEWSQKEKCTIQLAEYVRISLNRFISHKYSNDSNMLMAFMLTQDAEEAIRSAIRQTSSGSYLAMDPGQSESLLENLVSTVGDLDSRPHMPVVITAMDIRRYVKKLIEPRFPELPVLSFQELNESINIQPISQINL